MSDTQTLTIYHIPGCPFSERIEIMLALKGLAMEDVEIDISKPRPDWLLAKSGGTTALPLLDIENGETLKESMVILRYLEDRYPEPAVRHPDPYCHAVEGMLAELSGPFSGAGYRMILNRDPDQRDPLPTSTRTAESAGCTCQSSPGVRPRSSGYRSSPGARTTRLRASLRHWQGRGWADEALTRG